MTQSLKGRSVIVTGGSKGIGKGIARVFALSGAKVAIMARHLDQAEAAAAEIDHGAFGVVGDVTSLASVESAFAAVATRNGGIDVLCANAGIFPQARLEDMTSQQWDEVVDTNLKGTFHAVKAAVAYLRKSDQGRIVLTSSITGPVTGFPGWSHYGATKAGQLGFMRTACIELAKYGITVNAVMPGNIITEGLAGLGEDYQKTMAASIPLKRLGTVEDIGHAALYFASKEAGYVTGQTIIVDGGQILPESLEALT
ncbi:3-oxoacyl-ACP reductase FabG [Mesorhizobium erdmanii]|uniref:3-oxoacyl-ACP reductase FabG n=1 Tax=Mesorhizobium erdmanii TaxID=1777866 RepID=A0A6M7UIY0_9HYPH|nr:MULTISPECIES: 3-oxoacyl-ACP reductase FabG [Mesorhizobium]OBQ58606.1 3-oxoacyl-ACP reductase [Mesorhizobium loti]QKC77919.1 3-oxoacyl-ACP reductase FabG [Mesorhizobium erdmanii]